MSESIEAVKGPLHVWSRQDWQGQRRCIKCGALPGQGLALSCTENWRKKKVAPAPGDSRQLRQGRMF